MRLAVESKPVIAGRPGSPHTFSTFKSTGITMSQPQVASQAPGGGWNEARRDPLSSVVYAENVDGSIGTLGVHFADGTYQTTAASGGGSPAGNDEEIQFNMSGAFASDPALTYDSIAGLAVASKNHDVTAFYDFWRRAHHARWFVR
jgi:hypothetical protein